MTYFTVSNNNPHDTAPENIFRLKPREKVQRESNTDRSFASNLLNRQISIILSINVEVRSFFFM